MTPAYLPHLLTHDTLDPALGRALLAELDYGAATDLRLLLVAAVEGLVTAAAPGYHRVTHIEPLPAARLLCRDAVVGKRLWTAAERAASLAHFDRVDLPALLNLWVRARKKYRQREKDELIARFDLQSIK